MKTTLQLPATLHLDRISADDVLASEKGYLAERLIQGKLTEEC